MSYLILVDPTVSKVRLMKYGKLAGNSRINATIYRCLEHLGADDVRAFLKKFKDQPHDEQQVLNTYRELILGAYLASGGLRVKYEPRVGGKTPEWSILDACGKTLCFVELANFHVDKVTEDQIERHLQAGQTWCGFMPPNAARLYQRIQSKVTRYRTVVEDANAAYVVAVFGEFYADVETSEIQECLMGPSDGLFNQYPVLSGFLFFEEHSGKYQFKYSSNPQAIRSFKLCETGEF